MIIKTMNIEELPQMYVVVNRNVKQQIVEEIVTSFDRSSTECIEVIDDKNLWANSNNFRRSFQNYLDNNYIITISVTIRGNRVFLIKESLQ